MRLPFGVSSSTLLDTGVLYAGLALRVFAPLALVPLLGRVLGPDGYGLLAIANAVTLWVWQITESGFPTTSARAVANASGREAIGTIVSASMGARFVMMVPAVIVGAALVAASPQLREMPWIGILSILLGIQSAFNLGWFFMAAGQRRMLALAETVPPVLTLGLCVLLVNGPHQEMRTLIIMNASALATNCVFWALAARWGRWGMPTRASVLHEIRPSLPFLIQRVGTLAITTSSTYLLGMLTTAGDVARYSVADKAVSAGTSLFTPLLQSIYPLTMRQFGDPAARRDMIRMAVLMLGAAVALAAIFGVGGDRLLVILMGPAYAQSGVYLPVLSLLIPLGITTQLITSCVLIPAHADRALVTVTMVVSLVSFGLAALLAWWLGPWGMVAARLVGSAGNALVLGTVAYSIVAARRAKSLAAHPVGRLTGVKPDAAE